MCTHCALVQDLFCLREELFLYHETLPLKPSLVVANKMDLPEAGPWLSKFRRRHRGVDVAEISCATGDGLDALKRELFRRAGRPRKVESALAPAAR